MIMRWQMYYWACIIEPGMVHDMQLLRRAIYIYGGEVGRHQNIQPMSADNVRIIKRTLDANSPVFLPAAIDFHPFPWIVYRLSQHTKLPEHTVKLSYLERRIMYQ